MPEITLTGYENRIKHFTSTHEIRIGKGQIKTLAYGLHKRQARMFDEDLERIFMHSDPTPKHAFRNIEDAEREAAA